MSIKTKRLRLLTDDEISRVTLLAAQSGTPIEDCPTCRSEYGSHDESGYLYREPGTYRLYGEIHQCDCDRQVLLRKHYLLANIPEQYQRLDWNSFQGPEEIRKNVDIFLNKWQSFRNNGMGVEFGGPDIGVGKTFCATYIARQLIQQNQSVYFIQFRDLLTALAYDGNTEEARRAKETPFLILDEVLPPFSSNSAGLFMDRFETLIRHRTNWNMVTIMTTNLTDHELLIHYPRPYSLLAAKQMRVNMDGVDYRMGAISEENLELTMNDEIRPLT